MWINVHVREKLGIGARSSHRDDAGAVLRLCVLEATLLRQLQNLIKLQLTCRDSVDRPGGGYPTRPLTAPASFAGNMAASLAAAAETEPGVDATSGYGCNPSPIAAVVAPRKFKAEEPTLNLELVFSGRLLGEEDQARSLAELGISDGAVVHCLKWTRINIEQEICCYPHRCSTDGGCVVRVVGERFPDSAKIACRFGTVVVNATVENDGEDAGIAQLRCCAPPHPAGPVTLSVSFDAGMTWLGGPAFWYVDASSSSCPLGIAVPSSCAGARGILNHAILDNWIRRDDHDDQGPGAGCA